MGILPASLFVIAFVGGLILVHLIKDRAGRLPFLLFIATGIMTGLILSIMGIAFSDANEVLRVRYVIGLTAGGTLFFVGLLCGRNYEKEKEFKRREKVMDWYRARAEETGQPPDIQAFFRDMMDL